MVRDAMPEERCKFSAAIPESAAPRTESPRDSHASRAAASNVLFPEPATPTTALMPPASKMWLNAAFCSRDRSNRPTLLPDGKARLDVKSFGHSLGPGEKFFFQFHHLAGREPPFSVFTGVDANDFWRRLDSRHGGLELLASVGASGEEVGDVPFTECGSVVRNRGQRNVGIGNDLLAVLARYLPLFEHPLGQILREILGDLALQARSDLSPGIS